MVLASMLLMPSCDSVNDRVIKVDALITRIRPRRLNSSYG